MTLDDYERAALRTVNPKLSEEERLLDAAAGLAEESGEILGLVRKHVYQSHALQRDKLTIELGDALWCLAMTAKSAGITLEQVAAANVAKLRTRYPDGYSDAASQQRKTHDAR
jgi:NTP pyrophosphatase (non-canonical NTP hydrolase)